MAVQVNIPTPLRRITNGQNQIEADASNVGELLEVLDRDYPGIRERLIDEEGEIRYFVNIYLNGEDVPLPPRNRHFHLLRRRDQHSPRRSRRDSLRSRSP